MKIGIDARIYSSKYTGIGRYVYEILKRIPKLDRSIEYTVFLSPKEYEKFKCEENVRKKIASQRHYSFSEQTVFLKSLLEEKLDLVHFPHFNAPILYKKKYVVTIHDLILHFYPGKKILNKAGYKAVIKNVTKNSEKIISVSSNTKKDIVDLLKVPQEKIKVIYNGIDQNFKPISDQEKRKFLNKTGFGKYFLYTGVHREHKNLSRLVDAFEIMMKKHKTKASLVITGKCEKKYDYLYKKIKDKKLEDFIFLTGFVPEEEMLIYLSSARAFVFPSLYEGFGFPPLEAMACNVPVCASNATAIPEVCGDAAHYFNPKDEYEMAEKMHEIFTKESLREDLIKKGQERVKMFSWDKCAEKTLEIYRKAIGD